MNENRVSVYVDGFNLYFGLKSSGFRRLYWLNIYRLAENLLRQRQRLAEVKYFTSRISGPDDKRLRQIRFLDAIETEPVTIFYGQFQPNEQRCPCGRKNIVPQEKMTDVNIAVELLGDAFSNRFDTALLVSADSDLTAPITAVTRFFPQKRVVVAFPPKRKSKRLAEVASAWFSIGRKALQESQFPDVVISKRGFPLARPTEWR